MDEPDSATPGVTEVRFALSDPAYPFVGITEALDCRVELERMLPRGDGEYAEFFQVTGADPARIMEMAEENDLIEPTLLSGSDDHGLFEFIVSGRCPARHLAELGAIPRDVTAEVGTGRLVAEIPPSEDASEIIQAFLDEHEAATLVAKRSKDHSTPLFTTEELRQTVNDQLTDRQREVLVAAYEAGYYERPSRTTGQEIAAEFGISSATLSQHLKASERKLISILVQDRIVSPSA